MDQTNSSSAPPFSAASDILDMAKSHCKPRVSLSQMTQAISKKSDQNSSASAMDILTNVKKLLMLIISVPFLPISRYYDLLGYSYRKGNAAKSMAVEKNLLIPHSFHSGRRGGKILLAEPTKAAFAMFNLPSIFENPGFLHRYIQHQVKVAMTAQGWKVSIEKSIKGKKIDAVLENDVEKIALEVAVTDKHEVVNVRKDIFQAGFDRIIIIGKDRKVVEAVIRKISAAFDSDIVSKVSCCLLADFIDGKTK